MKLSKWISKIMDIWIGVLLFYTTVTISSKAIAALLYLLCNAYVYLKVEYIYFDLYGSYMYNRDVEISIKCVIRLLRNKLISYIVNVLIATLILILYTVQLI